MAQGKVTEFFNSRKRTVDLQPSKRRKLTTSDVTDSTEQEHLQLKASPAISTRTRARGPKAASLNVPNAQTADSSDRAVAKDVESVPVRIVNAGKKKTDSKSRPRASKKAVSVSADSSQKTLKQLFTNKSVESSDSAENGESSITPAQEAKQEEVPEVLPTAACDDHCTSPPSSPSKRVLKSSSGDVVCSKRSRVNNRVRKDLMKEETFLTPDKGYDFAKFMQKDVDKQQSARKKVALKKPSSVKKKTSNTDKSVVIQDQKTSATDKTAKETPLVSQPNQLASMKKPILSNPKDDGAHSKKDPPVEADKNMTTNPVILKEHLTKCGKLNELKEKLAQYGKAKAKLEAEKRKKEKTVEKEKRKEEPSEKAKQKQGTDTTGLLKSVIIQDKSNKCDPGHSADTLRPAYERFHALAEPVPPSLTLPYKYKTLQEMFNAMETVISMLHNRSEICTFPKLKPAVENIVRKQFDLEHIGKIITVYPDAYKLRQEKGLPSFGKKVQGYQLTMEPQLKDTLVSENIANQLKSMSLPPKSIVNKEGKSNFSAAHIIERKSIFHRNLVQIVKIHHKKFLSTLKLPITIADEKLNRWHPKFNVDEVEDVKTSSVPQPPDYKKLTTAGQVLDETQGYINSRVKAALEKVAAKSVNSDVTRKLGGEMTKEEKRAANNSPKPSPPHPVANQSLSGVSMSLLERIRAKEAEKQMASMTRSVEDDKRLERMERLPDLVRILRSFYVTQKKPSISMEDAIQRLTDSTRSYMGKAEAEKHFQLIVELLPEWITVIKISKGSFVKINKDKEISMIISKLNQTLKQSK